MKEHFREDNIICPHCDHVNEEWWEYTSLKHDGDTTEINCNDCDKLFTVEINMTYSFTSTAIECEENKHNYVVTNGEPTRCEKWVSKTTGTTYGGTVWDKTLTCTECGLEDLVNHRKMEE